MKKWYLVGLLCANLAALTFSNLVHAAVIYDNGDPTSDDAFQLFGYNAFDDFSFAADATVNGAEIVLSTNASLEEWNSSNFASLFTYTIRADNSGVPGTVLDTGSLLNPVASSSALPTFFSNTIIQSFDLQSSFAASANTTYWIGFESTSNVGYWALSDSVTGNPGKTTNNSGASWYELSGKDASFKLNGELATVPVPAAVWLFGSGLLGLVGIARRTKAA